LNEPNPSLSSPGFEAFFRNAYKPLVHAVMFAGGDPHQAEDAVSAAMVDVLQRWDEIVNPRAYARRAAISHLINAKKRGLERIRARIIEQGHIPPEHAPDPDMVIWEQQEWVTLLLKSLPPAQREVMACIFDTLTCQEIAQLLGKTDAAVRQNLRAARKRLASYLAENDGAEDRRHEDTERRPDEHQQL
jgi:RNA polymerase sigma factor (sigma-70 family)